MFAMGAPESAMWRDPLVDSGRVSISGRSTERGGCAMAEAELDELGPVDYLVVEFPAGQANFTGEMAAELSSLVSSGTIRILDVMIVTKASDGSIDAFEIDDFEGLDELRQIETELADLLAMDDVADLAAAMEPGSVAG